VTVEIGGERFQAMAVITTSEERQRLFKTQAELMPIFNDYQKKTTDTGRDVRTDRLKAAQIETVRCAGVALAWVRPTSPL
jgi:hypothetical protein